MADDKKKQPFEDATEDQQKGGEATATDQDFDVTEVTDTEESGDTLEDSDLTEDTTVEEDTTTTTDVEDDDQG